MTMHPMRLVFGLVSTFWAAHLRAGPPLLTDDPDTPGPNHWEINTALTSFYADHAWLLGTPLVDMNYGVGEHIQLKYQVPFNELVPEHGGVVAGMGNTLAGVKWRFIDQTNSSWLEVSTYPQLECIYPESSARRGLAVRGDNVLLPVEVERIYKKLTAYAEAGYIWNEYVPKEGWFGLAVQYDLTEKFSPMGEFYGGYHSDFQDSGMSFNLGFSWKMTEHAALITSAGRGIYGPAEWSPSFQSYLGIQWTF
jgi:hypothetical protein